MFKNIEAGIIEISPIRPNKEIWQNDPVANKMHLTKIINIKLELLSNPIVSGNGSISKRILDLDMWDNDPWSELRDELLRRR